MSSSPNEPESEKPEETQVDGKAFDGESTQVAPVVKPDAVVDDDISEAATSPGGVGLKAKLKALLQEKEAEGIWVSCYGASDVGLVREHNEDNWVIIEDKEKIHAQMGESLIFQVSGHGALFAVCDGMGGAAAGEVASQLAVDTFSEQVYALEGAVDREAFSKSLVAAVEAAGTRIYETATRDISLFGMGTTATLAGLIDDHLMIGQVGDSRAYLLRNRVLTQLTRDQTLVNQLIAVGQLTEEEALNFEHSNIILQALGTTEDVQVDLVAVKLCRGDRVLLCSDGLSGMVPDDMLEQMLFGAQDPEACCRLLIDAARSKGGEDNITTIVVDFEGKGLPEPQAEAPVQIDRLLTPNFITLGHQGFFESSFPDTTDPSSQPVHEFFDRAPSNEVRPGPEVKAAVTGASSWVPWIVAVALVLVGSFYVVGAVKKPRLAATRSTQREPKAVEPKSAETKPIGASNAAPADPAETNTATTQAQGADAAGANAPTVDAVEPVQAPVMARVYMSGVDGRLAVVDGEDGCAGSRLAQFAT